MQGLGSLDLLNKGVGGFNPIGDYNKALGSDAFKVNSPDSLHGHLDFNMPENIDSIQDKELVSDLKEVGATDKTGSADKLYKSFESALSDGVKKLNSAERTAESNIETFATGGNIDIHTVMLSAEKANLSMQLALQLKNKIVSAYKELSKMQI
jgi:flagellar hook-basal body complex protein FliE